MRYTLIALGLIICGGGGLLAIAAWRERNILRARKEEKGEQ